MTAMKKGSKRALGPQRRFSAFRNEPAWEEKRLGDVAEVLQGYGFPENLQGKTEGEYPFYKVSDISNALQKGGCFIRESVHYINGDTLQALKAKLIPVDSTIFAKIGEAIRLNRRAITTVPCLIDNNVAGLKRIEGKAVDRFVHYAFSMIRLADYSGGAVPSVNKSTIEDIPIVCPEIPEQQKIGDCLSSLDELIVANSQRLDTLKSHKKGLMQQLFPQEGETVPRIRFPEFQNAEEWAVKPLSDLLYSLDAGVSVNSGDRPAMGNEFGVLKTSAVTNGIFEPQENKVVFDALEIGRVKEPVQADTIIISRMNTPALVGANAYVETSLKNIFLPDRLWAAKSKPGTSMRFVALILGSDKCRAALSKLAKGSSGSMKNITKPDVLAFSVMAPSPAEQQHIANCLATLDDLIFAQTQKLDALKTHKKGLMQQLFPSPEAVEA